MTRLLSASASLVSRCQQCFHHALAGRAPTARSLCTAHMKARYPSQRRRLHLTATLRFPPPAPQTKDRGPPSKEETQTDFAAMNILSNTPAPTTAVDACMDDGFALNSGLKVTEAGVLLIGGEAFMWRPWIRSGRQEREAGSGSAGSREEGVKSAGGTLRNTRGQWDVGKSSWGILDLAWPKPDLLILGTGSTILPLSPETRRDLNELGIRVEVQDTRNAAAQFNLLATERGVQQVAAALIPMGWRDHS